MEVGETGLLRMEPKVKERLYLGVDPEMVDASAANFTWDWIKKATKIKVRSELHKNIEGGRFGIVEKLGTDAYRFAEGHRAICRFNNQSKGDPQTLVVTREQYQDMMENKPVREMTVIVKGKPFTKTVSMKNYNSADFIAARRYTNDQALIIATERVKKDVDKGTVGWCKLPVDSKEYQIRRDERLRMFQLLYMKEMVLIAKDSAGESDYLNAADLPASILSLIDNKLSVTQAESYISRILDIMRIDPNIMDKPLLFFSLHQMVLEEMRVEHLRDLQRLYGDNIETSIEVALEKAQKRLQFFTPSRLGGGSSPTPSSGGWGDEENDSPLRTPSVDDDPFG